MRTRRDPSSPYRHFVAALLTYGSSHEEIAAGVGVTPRQISSYLAGDLPRGSLLARHPRLLRALCHDVDESHTQPE